MASCAPELQSLPSVRPCSVAAEPGDIDVHIYTPCTYMYIVVVAQSLHSMSAASANAVKASRCNYFVGSY